MKQRRNTRIESMKREIERRGGTVGTIDDAPDWLVEQFLAEVLACPDCQAHAAQEPGSEREH